ncbi:winged helix DNA-binding domain-containing protein [Antribacter gilvus]|uniref:winged helix DNA-binding domain-containing protein n=1 Tax=Antribacter gilvus TaxID=2304675 RepID=UPI000F79BC90|nr:winged helix DNA-binding domain-containing protein [Antribacter gilvus]
MTLEPALLTADAARRLRLRSQGLLTRGPDGDGPTPVEVVRRMVALQGQDLPAVLRAIAVRSRPGTTLEDVRAAFDAGDLVRGWTQRGTLFATTPHDLAALVSLTGERMTKAGTLVRTREGIDDAVVARAEAVAREALSDSAVTRATLIDLWQQAGVPIEGQRGYHLIATLALRGLLHWGPFAGAQQLLVASPVPHSPQEPAALLRRIALAYFASRGPATVDDLAWWLGLPKTPVRAAVASLPDDAPLAPVVVDGRAMLAVGHEAASLERPAGVVLVPGFDEIVLGYQDRSLVASPEAMRTVVPFINGIFRPAVLVDGQVVGTWRRAPKKGEAPFDLVPGVPAGTVAEIEAAITAWPHG